MENEKKKNICGIVLVVILVLIILGLVGFILVDKDVIKLKDSDVKENKEEFVVDISSEEERDMLKITELVFDTSKSSLKFNDISNQEKLTIAGMLLDNDENRILEIEGSKGNDLINVIKKYFGEESSIIIEDFECRNHDDDMSGSSVLYKYDSATDTYTYNNEHAGHGGLVDSVDKHIYKEKISFVDNKYKLVVGVYYMKNSCGETCPPTLDNTNIYSSYNDALNETNSLMEASKNNNYCYVNNDDFTLYDCDYEKIYNGVKDKLDMYTFTFEKVGDNIIFKEYSINK